MMPEEEKGVKRKRGRPPKNKGPPQDIKVTNTFAAPISISTEYATTTHQGSDRSKRDQTDIKFQLD